MTQRTKPQPDLTEDDLHRCVLYAGPDQRVAFLEKFGREPSEDDPWHFDPDADEPRPYNRDAVRSGTALICHLLADLAQYADDEFEEAIFEAMLHAATTTGLVLDQYSYLRVSDEDRDAYDDALRAYWDTRACDGLDMGIGRFG